MAVSDYRTNPDENTTRSGINIAEGCAPSGINNAIRQLMADVKSMSQEQEGKFQDVTASEVTATGSDVSHTLGDWMKDVSDNSLFILSLNGELAVRHEGVTENGVGNHANYLLVVPDAAKLVDDMKLDDSGATSNLNDVLAVGYNALGTALRTPEKRCSDNIAIGSETMSQGAGVGPHNIAIGLWALRDLCGTKPQDANNGGFDADRNIAIGSLCFTHMTKGRCNVGLGRDVGQTVTTGNFNTIVGYAAMAGSAPVGMDGTIALQNEVTGEYNTVVGARAAGSIDGDSKNNLVLGGYAAVHVKDVDYAVIAGGNAAEFLDYYKSANGRKLLYPDRTVEYSQSGTDLTIQFTADGMASSGYIRIQFKSGDISIDVAADQQTLEYTLNDQGYPVVQSPQSYSGAAGTCLVVMVELAEEVGASATQTSVFGGRAAQYAGSLQASTVIGGMALAGTQDDAGGASADFSEIMGALAARQAQVSDSTIIGYRCCGKTFPSPDTYAQLYHSVCIGELACEGADTVSSSVVSGYNAGCDATSIKNAVILGDRASYLNSELEKSVVIGSLAGANKASKSLSDVFVGYYAGRAVAEAGSKQCVALGEGALANMETGLDPASSTLTNAIAIGAWSRVSGNNQCQLGSSSVSTYAYGSVQDRSDERDKTDIRDTLLGLNFIKALRPVDFRWDYREDYTEIQYPDGNEEENTPVLIRHEKDGSRKRTRFHHGLIAQEVKSVMDDLGVDFGGYQDHKINGGADVLTIGYAELIAPLIKAVQELAQNETTLLSRMTALEQRLAALEAAASLP